MTQMLWQSTDDLSKKVIRAFGNAPPKTMDRASLADRAMAVWRNDYGALVDEALRAIFHEENWRWFRLHPHTSTNLLRRVVEETCLVYQEPASRYLKLEGGEESGRATATGEIGDLLDLSDEELLALPDVGAVAEAAGEGGEEEPGERVEGDARPARARVRVVEEEEPEEPLFGAEEPEAPTEFEEPEETPFDRLLAAVDFDALMEQCHQLARFLPAVWIMPVVRADPTDDEPARVRLDFDIHTPVTSGVDTDPSDATQATAFWTWRKEEDPQRKGHLRKVRYVWERDGSFTKWDEGGRKLPNDLAADERHPYGRLPVVVVRLGRPLDSYYLDGQGGDLYDATIEVALLRTLQNARYRDSSFKQLVIDGDPKDVPADQVMGNPSIPIYAGEGGASVLDLSINLDQLSQVVRQRVEDIIVRYGISPGQWSMSEKAQSGFSKKMDQAKINRINRKERKWLAEAERDLYRLTAITLRHYSVPEIGDLDPDAEFVVDYAEPVYEEEPVTQAKADSLAVKLNRTNYVELLMRDNPDMTARQALRALALNRLVNERFAGRGTGESSLMDLLASEGRLQPQQAPGGAGPGGLEEGGVPQPPGPTPPREEEE